MANGHFQAGNAGRPKGAKNKSTRAVDDAFQAVFDGLQSHATANLTAWAAANPGEFYKLMGKKLTTSAESVNHTMTETVSEAQARAEAEAFLESQRVAQHVVEDESRPLRTEDEAGLPAGEPALQGR